jgi:hypothetical protein
MKRRIAAIILACTTAFSLTACASKADVTAKAANVEENEIVDGKFKETKHITVDLTGCDTSRCISFYEFFEDCKSNCDVIGYEDFDTS